MPLAEGPFGGREANWDRRRNPSHANTGAAARRESQGAAAAAAANWERRWRRSHCGGVGGDLFASSSV